MDAVNALRHEFPALGLTIGFAPKKDRALIADILLFWLEVNRARSSSENLIAAARITWWRDAIDEKKPEGVPLAERLLAHQDIPHQAFGEMIGQLVELTLNQAGLPEVMHEFAKPFAPIWDGDADELAHILLAFKMAMTGQAHDLGKIASPLPIPFKMMAWLCHDPARLNYPDEKPLLSLSMMMASLKKQV